MQRDFTPADLSRILSRNKYEGAIAAATLPGAAETDWLLDLARREPWILGVIGRGIEDRWLHDKLFAAVRTSDPEIIRLAAAADMAVDVPLRVADLSVLLPVLEALSGARLCLIPDNAPDWNPEPWGALVRLPHAMVKIRGLINSAGGTWTAATYRPFVQRMLELCGPARLMYASDWPYCMHTGTWKEALAAFTQSLGAQTIDVRSQILGENAARHYRLANAHP